MSSPVFKEVRYDLNSLINYIELGEIGLPDLQRPFVWKNVKVRDLFDSMYRGFPVGYVLFWQNTIADHVRSIGGEEKQKPPRLLVVDGQQRLTSVYAVVKGIPVVRENYSTEPIRIAFNPLRASFEVMDAAILRDKTYIPDISVLWSKETDIFEVVEQYFDALEGVREVTVEEKKNSRDALRRLQSLLSFPFTALELSPEVTEEEVAEVFVRINSRGTPLNQADFILTLMSVFWDQGRKELEAFSRRARDPSSGQASPYNTIFQPEPDQLLRASVGVAFKRSRLRHVYSILRGKDLETEEVSNSRRDEQFGILKKAQEKILNVQYWHDFLTCVRAAGFRNARLISSQNAVIFAYVLYQIGRIELGIEEQALRKAIAQWLFMSMLTGRYTRSGESTMEFDLALFRGVSEGEIFLGILAGVCQTTLTDDYWEITLPTQLATSSPRSPSLFAYQAGLVLLGATALYSKQSVADMIDGDVSGVRGPAERHHLFPKAHLASLGIKATREVNQIANMAFIEWGDNVKVSKTSPAEYVSVLEERFSKGEMEEMYRLHALQEGWQDLDYEQFLERRREAMAEIIREAYQKVEAGGRRVDEQPAPVVDSIQRGESDTVEFKSTLRVNLHTSKNDPRIELSALKTIAGFLNGAGGRLIIGVDDDGNALGLADDKFPNEDKMSLHLVNIVKDRLGMKALTRINHRFEEYDDGRVLIIDVEKSNAPVFVKDGSSERFYVRTGPATSEMSPSDTQAYLRERFD
jgi:hypothetical protein